jgi:hypothetical protein
MYGVRQFKAGRKVGNHLNINDVLSHHAQRAKGIHVERLDRFDAEAEEWKEIVVEDRRAGPAEVVATRNEWQTGGVGSELCSTVVWGSPETARIVSKDWLWSSLPLCLALPCRWD